jgi:hypothetical protein
MNYSLREENEGQYEKERENEPRELKRRRDTIL